MPAVTCTSTSPQDDWLGDLNPESLLVVKGAYATPDLAAAKPGDRCAAGGDGGVRGALHCAHVRLDLQQMCGSTAAGSVQDCHKPSHGSVLLQGCGSPSACRFQLERWATSFCIGHVASQRFRAIIFYCLYHLPLLCRFQLERLGYFCVDTESAPGAMVLNRTCTLKVRCAHVPSLV